MHKSQAGALPGVLPPLPCQRQGKALPHPFFSTAAKEEKVPRTDPGSIQEPGPTPGLQQPLGAGGSSPKPGPWSHRSPLPALCPHSLTFLTHSPRPLLPPPLPASLGGAKSSHSRLLRLLGLSCPSSGAGSAPQDPKIKDAAAQAGAQTLLKAQVRLCHSPEGRQESSELPLCSSWALPVAFKGKGSAQTKPLMLYLGQNKRKKKSKQTKQEEGKRQLPVISRLLRSMPASGELFQ